MSVIGQGNPGQPVSGEPEETFLAASKLQCEGGLTLEPIRTDGPDAIDPNGIPEIKATWLHQLEISRDNCFHQVDVHRADDLFRCATLEGLSTPFPSTGTITAAVFLIEFCDSPEPRRVVVCLPDTVLLERPSDAPIVFRWLDKCRLRLPRKLAQILLALSLSLIAANASPLVDDDTDDADDDDPESQVLAFGL